MMSVILSQRRVGVTRFSPRSQCVGVVFMTLLIHLTSMIPAATAAASEIVFGQSAPFSGGSWEPGNNFNAGLLSAFDEINALGGVGNRTLKLVSLDDKYMVANIAPNIAQLMTVPDLFAFVSFMGSATTAAALPFFKLYEIPCIGPLTGSAVFRTPFNPWTINVRSGYDDEAMAMLRLFVSEKHYTRISIIYQDDAFGAPSASFISSAMSRMKLSLNSVHKYDKLMIPSYNYSQWAQTLLGERPQGIILYAVEGFSNPFLEEFAKISTFPVDFVTGSWIGDANRNFLRAKNLNPTTFYMTTVVPHPNSTFEVSRRYRAAMTARYGPAEAPSRFDYLSMEGYIVGRFVVEALKRTLVLTRANFLETVYQSRMFSIDDLLVGPFSNDCEFNDPRAKGRSSMCYCNQGLRFVGTTQLDANYNYVVAAPDLRYDMTECYATQDVVVRPLVLAEVLPTTSSGKEILQQGLRMLTTTRADSTSLNIPNGQWSTINTALGELENETLLVGALTGVPLGPQSSLLVIPFLEGTIPAPTGFVRSEVRLFPTVQQELFTMISYLNTIVGTPSQSQPQPQTPPDQIRSNSHIYILYQEMSVGNYSTRQRIRFEDACQLSLDTFQLTATYLPFSSTDPTASSSLSAALNTIPRDRSAHLIVFGLSTTSEATTLLTALNSSRSSLSALPAWNLYLSFTDISSYWSVLTAPAWKPLWGSVRFVSNLPVWTSNTTSAFAQHYLSYATTGVGNISHPMNAAGFFIASAIQRLVSRADDASPAELLTELYRSTVLVIDDVVLGPFTDNECARQTTDCQCNVGARSINLHSVDALMSGTGVLYKYQQSKCSIEYVPLPPRSQEKVNVSAIAGGVVGGILGILLFAMTVALYLFNRWRQTKAAPKDPNKPLYVALVAVKGLALMWEKAPQAVPGVLSRFEATLRELVQLSNCYYVKKIGDCALVVATDPERLAQFSSLLHAELIRNPLYTDAQAASVLAKDPRHTHRPKTLYTQSSRSLHHSKPGSEPSSRSNHSSEGRPVRCELSVAIGIHSGFAHIEYNRDRHTYDYSGPAVDGAATCADASAKYFTVASAEVGTRLAQHEHDLFDCVPKPNTSLYFVLTKATPQYNIDTFPLTSANQKGGEAEESAASNLDAAKHGASNRRVTILVVRVTYPKERMAHLERAVTTFTWTESMVQETVKRCNGTLLSSLDGTYIIAFNAFGSVAGQVKLGTQCAFAIRDSLLDEFGEDEFRMTGGLASGTCLAGTITTKEGLAKKLLVGPTVQRAWMLEALCTDYSEACFLVGGELREELDHLVYYQIVTLVPHKGGRLPVLAPMQLRTDEGDDEWMYALEKGDVANPFSDINKAFDDLLVQGSTAKMESLTQSEGERIPQLEPALNRLRMLLPEVSAEPTLWTRPWVLPAAGRDRIWAPRAA